MSRFDEHVEKYKPYLNEFDFTGTEPYKRLEHQRINPNVEVINRRIAEAKRLITNDILNEITSKMSIKFGKKIYKGYKTPKHLGLIFLFVEYTKLIEPKKETPNPHPQIFAGNTDFNFRLWEHLYRKLDLKPKVKASTLFTYFKENEHFVVSISISKYFKYLKENNYEAPTKILELNYKQEDILKNQIPQIEKDYVKSSK